MNDAVELLNLTRRLRRTERGLIGCLVLLVVLAVIVARDRLGPISELRLSNPGSGEELVLQPGAIRIFATEAKGGVETVISAGLLHHKQSTTGMTRRFVEVSLSEVDVIDYANQRRAVLSPVTIGVQSGISSTPDVRPAWTALRADGISMTDAGGHERLHLGRVDEQTHGLALFAPDGEEFWRTPGVFRN